MIAACTAHEQRVATDAAETARAKRDSALEVGAGLGGYQVRSIHWFPYDRVGVVNADP